MVNRNASVMVIGKQMQLDFGQYQFSNGLKLYIFVAVLSASRYKYIIFQYHPFQTKDVIHHLLDCFDYFGGIPFEMVIDQDKLLVVSENHGDIIFTKDFKYLKWLKRRANGKISQATRQIPSIGINVLKPNVISEIKRWIWLS